MTDEELAAKGCQVPGGIGCFYRAKEGRCEPCKARDRIEAKKIPKPTPVCSSCGYSARDHIEEREGNFIRRHLIWQKDGGCASWNVGAGSVGW